MTPERDGATSLFPVESITPGVPNATQNGSLVDMLGYHSATVVIHVGVGGIAFSAANRIDFSLLAGNAADGSDLIAVIDDDIVADPVLSPPAVANGVVRSLVAAHPVADVQKVGYVGGKRFLRLVATFAGAHAAGTPIAASVARGLAGLRGAA